MDFAKHPTDEPLLTTAELAARHDFALGGVIISPSTRTLRGPLGPVDIEPRVMQVLVVLADAAGQVVTRETLFNRCWGGVFVGDDSLNRAVAAVRRSVAAIGGRFEVETIPRTGYRLSGEITVSNELGGEANVGRMPLGLSRRSMLAAGAAGVAAAGGLGAWAVRRSEADRQFHQLIERAEDSLLADERADALRYSGDAVAMRPNDAGAQGLHAYSELAETGGQTQGAPGLAADQQARAALELDPNEPYARLTQTMLRRSMLDLSATEDRLRAILASAPNNVSVMRQLWDLYASVGLERRASGLVERAIALEPLAPAANYPRAQLLWILGQNAEADRVIDRAMNLWPSHPFVRFARFTIYAFTGRPSAARAMLESEKTAPQYFTPEAIALWRVSLNALEEGSPVSTARARTANIDGAKRSPALSAQAIMALSALEEIDAAFEIANSLFLFRNYVARHPSDTPARPSIGSTAWRFTPWLFTPPAAGIRADRRFDALCQGIGLTDYWSKRGVKPDYLKA